MASFRRLGELLIATGYLSENQLQEALNIQQETRERLGTILIQNGFISEHNLIEALTMQLGIDFVDLTKIEIPVELAQIVPQNIAKKYKVIPVKLERGQLYLAMSDPLNFYAQEEVKKASKKTVVPMVATSTAIDYAIQILYGNEGAAKAIEDMKKENRNVELVKNNAFVSNKLGDESIESAPTIRLVNSILERAVHERASDIHMEPQETEMRVRMRIDGVLRHTLTIPKNLENSVVARIKIMSGLNIAERRIPQDGRFNVQIKEKDIDLRISTLPTVYGEKIVGRLLDKSSSLLSKEAIGLQGDDLVKFDHLLKYSSGVVLIVGPTGSGKSSTMYTMIGSLNNESVNLVTLEDPVEYNIDRVNQVQINEKTGMTFASGLRSILRQDPDIICVGEIRDGETAEIAMRAAITGHVVLSTIHTNDALGTIERLHDIGVPSYLTSSALRGVISQRLVRRICPQCKEAYTPSSDELESLSLPLEMKTTFYRGKGCPYCFDTGYRGRIAVFEILSVNREMRHLITENAPRQQIEEALKKSDFVSLKQNGIRLIKEGTTTVSEVLRVVNEDD